MNESLTIDVRLDDPYDQARDKVIAALKDEGFGVLTEIDVRQAMKEKLDEEFRPYCILGACNPPLAHKVLTAEPRVGVMLPCNVTVEAHPEGGSHVRIGNPTVLMDVGGLSESEVLRETAGEVRKRLDRVAASLRAG